MTYSKPTKEGTVLSLILFIIAPFLSFFGSLFRMRNERNLWVIFFFYLLFGACFTINEETGFDSLRYVEFFNSLDPRSSLQEVYITNIITDGNAGDIYFPIVAWIAKHISYNNYHVMFFLFALIFAIFTIKTLKLFYEAYAPKDFWLYNVVIILLILNNFIFNINGMRFWTAAWILTYGIMSYYTFNKKIGLIWIAITPLVHTTFIFPIIIFILSFFVGKFEKTWMKLLWFSIPFSFLSVQLIPYISPYIPDVFAGKFAFYTEARYIIERSSGTGFTYLENFMRTFKLIVEAFIVYKVYLMNKDNKSWQYRIYFEFTIVFVAVTTFLSAIPSMGRYIIVGFPFVLFFLWVNLDRNIFGNYLILLATTMLFSILDLIVNKVLPTMPSEILYTNTVSLITIYL